MSIAYDHWNLEQSMHYDTVIVNGRWFDGTGAPSAVRNIGVRNGRVAAVAAVAAGALDTTGADVIDATGQWVIPGSSTSIPTTTSKHFANQNFPNRCDTA